MRGGRGRPRAFWAAKLSILAVALAGSGLGLAWVASWFQPSGPTTLILAGAGCESNLEVPHDAWGRGLLADLADLAGATVGAERRRPDWRVLHGPRTLSGDSRWDDGLDSIEGDAVMVVLAMNGGADRDGAFLIPDDASLAGGRIRLAAVIERLGRLPDSLHKVLVLDATIHESSWMIGLLQNDFARALAALEDRIAAVPNLVVIASSGVGERSWIDFRRGRTTFGDRLVRGLAGDAAGADGCVTAEGLHAYLAARVGAWARANRGAAQTPVLLPGPDRLPEADRDRARRIVLARAATFARGPTQAAGPFATLAGLEEVWRAYAESAGRDAGRRNRSIHAWRRYEAMLLRCEELAIAGATGPAADAVRRLQEFRNALDRIGPEGLASRSCSLASPSLLVGSTGGAAPGDLDRIFEAFWGGASPTDSRAAWDRAKQIPGARERFGGRLLERAATGVREPIDRAAALLPILDDDPEGVLPVELETLAAFQRHRPPSAAAAGSEHARVVGLALEVRRAAERAAAGVAPGEGASYGEEVAPRGEDVVDEADRERRLAEDLLFSSDPADWEKARRRLERAGGLYGRAESQAGVVRRGLALRDECRSRLPAYSEWLISAVPRDDPIDDLERAWSWLHAFDGGEEAAAEPARLDVAARALARLQAAYEGEIEALSASPGPRDAPRIEAALRVPSDRWEDRKRLLDSLASAVAAEVEPGPGAAQDVPTSAGEGTAERRRARIARGALGIGGRTATESEAASRLVTGRLLGTVARLSEDLAEAGRQLARPPASRDVARLRAALSDASASAGRLPGAVAIPPPAGGADVTAGPGDWIGDAPMAVLSQIPEVVLRDVHLQSLMLRLASRTADDRWWGPAPAVPPYYVRAAGLYLDDSRSLDPAGSGALGAAPSDAFASDRIAAVRARLAGGPNLILSGPGRASLAGDSGLRLDYRVEGGPGAAEAFPVAWLDGVGPGLVAGAETEPGRRTPVAVGGRSSGEPGFLQVAVSSRLSAEAEAGGILRARELDSTVAVAALWRGRPFRFETAVSLDPVPTSTFTEPRPNGPARIAVRADERSLEVAGRGRGAVAFVLDCSGSMAGPVGRTTKYQAVVDVLLKLLQEVPRGTLVGVWTFGQRLGPDDSLEDAESTIRPAFSLASWDPDDRDNLDRLAASLRGLTPCNGSPIVRTLVRAKDALLGVEGSRLIVALTDGADTRFFAETAGRSPRPTIAGFLAEEFRDAATQVVVAGFRVAPSERMTTIDQLRILEAPPIRGRLLLVDDLPTLEDSVRSSIRPEVLYRLENLDGSPVAGAPSGGQGVGFADDGDRFIPSGVPPGRYRLRFVGREGPGQLVEVDPGDTLILRLEWGPGRLSVRRERPGSGGGAEEAVVGAGGWAASVLASRWSPGGELEMDFALGKEPQPEESPLRETRPARVRFEVSPRASAGARTTMRQIDLGGRATATYRVRVSGWPRDPQGDGPARPVVRAWWTGREPAAGLLLRRGAEFQDPTELRDRSFPLAGGRVRILSIGVEDHVVEVAPGRFDSRSCLVIRLLDDASRPIRASLDGIPLEGSEHREYPRGGTTVALFWPVSPGLWRQAPLSLRIDGEAAFADAAEAAGTVARFDSLPPPEAFELRPPALPAGPGASPVDRPGRD